MLTSFLHYIFNVLKGIFHQQLPLPLLTYPNPTSPLKQCFLNLSNAKEILVILENTRLDRQGSVNRSEKHGYRKLKTNSMKIFQLQIITFKEKFCLYL